MLHKIQKYTFIFGSCLFLLSCATQTNISLSLDEESGIIFEGNLVGLTIEVGSSVFDNISNSDLIVDKTRSRKSPNSRVKILKLNLIPGKTKIIAQKDGVIFLEKDVYIIKGQMRRIKL